MFAMSTCLDKLARSKYAVIFPNTVRAFVALQYVDKYIEAAGGTLSGRAAGLPLLNSWTVRILSDFLKLFRVSTPPVSWGVHALLSVLQYPNNLFECGHVYSTFASCNFPIVQIVVLFWPLFIFLKFLYFVRCWTTKR